jgi:hypothetical protein
MNVQHRSISRRSMRIAPLGILALLLVSAGCSDSVTTPNESMALDAESALFLAEASVSMNAAPETRAAAAVAHAGTILARAQEAISKAQGVSPEVLALLAEASGGCARAQAALDAQSYRVAVMAAMGCANLAREAVLRAQAERRTAMTERAATAVADASALVTAAAALVNESSPEGAKTVLARAQEELARAQAALEARRFPEAISRAARAGAAAQRILAVLG